ncbi:MAG: hypothetical protein IT379_15390 [Deltaproteobacteria bacterium]|nr:hypothetical protein [Deltaproteobacteria bacterium]
MGDLSDGLVERSVVGISIGTPMFDATRALERVVFHDVEDEQQTREIAVPPPLTTL